METKYRSKREKMGENYSERVEDNDIKVVPTDVLQRPTLHDSIEHYKAKDAFSGDEKVAERKENHCYH